MCREKKGLEDQETRLLFPAFPLHCEVVLGLKFGFPSPNMLIYKNGVELRSLPSLKYFSEKKKKKEDESRVFNLPC